jgi:hypothetical protein
MRYSLAEAKAEATRRAAEFVAARADGHGWRHISTTPDSFASPGRKSKHPVAWLAMYAPVPPEGAVIDGGELFVAVDLELGTVGVRDFWATA